MKLKNTLIFLVVTSFVASNIAAMKPTSSSQISLGKGLTTLFHQYLGIPSLEGFTKLLEQRDYWNAQIGLERVFQSLNKDQICQYTSCIFNFLDEALSFHNNSWQGLYLIQLAYKDPGFCEKLFSKIKADFPKYISYYFTPHIIKDLFEITNIENKQIISNLIKTHFVALANHEQGLILLSNFEHYAITNISSLLIEHFHEIIQTKTGLITFGRLHKYEPDHKQQLYNCLEQSLLLLCNNSYAPTFFHELSFLIDFYPMLSTQFHDILKTSFGPQVITHLIIQQRFTIPQLQHMMNLVHQNLHQVFGNNVHVMKNSNQEEIGIIIENKTESLQEIVLINENGHRLGWCRYYINTTNSGEKIGWISLLHISKHERHKGYGPVLLHMAQKRLIEQGCIKIQLQASAHDLHEHENPKEMQNKLLNFYKKYGGQQLDASNIIEFKPELDRIAALTRASIMTNHIVPHNNLSITH